MPEPIKIMNNKIFITLGAFTCAFLSACGAPVTVPATAAVAPANVVATNTPVRPTATAAPVASNVPAPTVAPTVAPLPKPTNTVVPSNAITAKYECSNGKNFSVVYEGDKATLTLDGKTYALKEQISGSGIRYGNAELTLIGKGNDAYIVDAKEKIIVEPCSSGKPGPLVAPNTLLGTWRLVESSKDGKSATGVESTLVFTTDRASGNGGCNQFNGAYTANDDKLKISPLASTRMACAGPAMSQETWYLQSLQTATRYEIDGLTLRIYFGGGKPVLTLTRQSASAKPQPTAAPTLVGSAWRLVESSKDGKSASNVESTISFTADTASGKGGCNNFGGSYTVTGDKIQFGNLASTLMACIANEMMTQEAWYLKSLNTATRYEMSGNTLKIYFDGGKQVLTFAKK